MTSPPDRHAQQFQAPRVVFVRQGEAADETLAELRSSETAIVVTFVRPSDVRRPDEALH